MLKYCCCQLIHASLATGEKLLRLNLICLQLMPHLCVLCSPCAAHLTLGEAGMAQEHANKHQLCASDRKHCLCLHLFSPKCGKRWSAHGATERRCLHEHSGANFNHAHNSVSVWGVWSGAHTRQWWLGGIWKGTRCLSGLTACPHCPFAAVKTVAVTARDPLLLLKEHREQITAREVLW